MIGRRIGRFRIVARLGHGGMGSVWEAEDERLGRNVALKLLSEDLALSPPARRRFEREARAASRLDHPGIAAVHDSGDFEGRLYIVTALVEGCTIRDRIRSGPLPVAEAVCIARAAAEALGHAHERGVLHRDISSANIMVSREGRVTVIDFGLARLRKEDSSRLTPTGATWGTGPYIPPEVIRDHDAGPRGDLYSLGVVLYEMLAGTPPFEAPAFEAMVNMILNQPAEPPSRRRPDVPAKLDRIILKALAKEPARRYATAATMIRDLDGLGLAPAAPTRPVPPVAPRPRPSTRRSSRSGPAPEPGSRLVAVLPFRDESPGRRPIRAQVFARGLAETVSAHLARVPGVQVIPPFALPSRASSGMDLVALEREVGANLVLAGSVQRVGKQIRVRFSLVGPRRVQVAADTLDGSMSDIPALEEQLVRRIAHALELEAASATLSAEQEPPDPAAHERYLQALGYLQRYENEASVDGAIQLLEKLARTQDRDARIPAALGRAYLAKYLLTYETGWEKRAVGACRAALKLDADLPEALVTLGHVHRETGRYAEAVRDYRRALSMKPNDADALAQLALTYQRSGEMENAERALRSAIELRPGQWSLHNMLGVLFFNQGHYQEAAGAWRQVTELSPDNARGYSNLGAAHYHMGRYQDAIAAYERSLEIRPDASAYTSLGTVFHFLGDRGRAVGALEKGRDLRPSDPRVWGNLADAYRWTPGHEEKAAAAFDRAIALRREQLKMNRNLGKGWAELAAWLAKRGRTREALRAIRRGLDLVPRDVPSMEHAIRVHHLAGDREEALRWARKVVQSGGDVAELERDPELAELRQCPDFERIVKGRRA